jgi:general nucleoside transport system permease protein
MDLFLESLTLAATPILLAGLGGMLTYRAGVLNVATEGIMLVSAFASIVVAAKSGNIWLGLAAGIGAALAISAVFGLGCLVLRADVFVVGIGINLIASGLCAFLLVRLLNLHGSYTPEKYPTLPTIDLGVFENVPILGPMFDGQSIIVFTAFAALVWAQVFVTRTRLGTYTTVAGEAPEALDAVGVSVMPVDLDRDVRRSLRTGRRAAVDGGPELVHQRHDGRARLHRAGRRVLRRRQAAGHRGGRRPFRRRRGALEHAAGAWRVR